MKVYFNNSCKICKAEIDLYKKEKIQDIDWIDITDNTLATKETSKNNKKSSIYLLKRGYLQQFLNDMREIMTYGVSSEYVNESLIRTENTKVTIT